MKTLLPALAVTVALGAAAHAQADFPNKPVKIIIDSAPGSATDVASRLMAERLTQVTKDQTLVARMVELGHLSPAEAADHPSRNEVAQALGKRFDLAPFSLGPFAVRGRV